MLKIKKNQEDNVFLESVERAFEKAYKNLNIKKDVNLLVYNDFEEAYKNKLMGNSEIDKEMYELLIKPRLSSLSATLLGEEIVVVLDNLEKSGKNLDYVASHELGHVVDLERVLKKEDTVDRCFEILHKNVNNASTLADSITSLCLQVRANKIAIGVGYSKVYFTEIEKQIKNIESNTCLSIFIDDYTNLLSCDLLENEVDKKKLEKTRNIFFEKTKHFDEQMYFKKLAKKIMSKGNIIEPESICEYISENEPVYRI